MNREEAVKRSPSEHHNYPDIIDSNDGLIELVELDVAGIPSWNRHNSNLNRKIIVEITSYKGISWDAIHFYGKLIVDGVYQATLSNPEKPKNLSFEQEKTYPLLNYKYEFKIKRHLTKEEIEKDPQRWECYDEGDLTQGYEKLDELIKDVKEIIKLRFTGDWDVYIQYPNGKREKLSL